MAISSKVEEIVLELTKTVGNIYDALNYGIGDVNIPGSSIFEINNLLSMANSGYPYFGILETAPLGCDVTYDIAYDPYYVTVRSGQVAYNGSVFNLQPQKIPLKKEWSTNYSSGGFGSSYKYGVTLGLPIAEVQKASQTWTTTVSTTCLSGTNILYVKDTSIAINLGFPLQAFVGNYLITFSKVTDDLLGLIVDPSYYNGSSFGTLPATYYLDNPVTFLFQPRVKFITGFPVLESNENVSTFDYFPPLPQSWIPIGKVMVKNPENPLVVDSGTGLTRTVVDMPTDISTYQILGDSSDKSLIIQSCIEANNALQSFKYNDYVRNTVSSVYRYLTTISSNSSLSNRELLATQPFRKTEFYSKGTSFSGLERFELPYNFSKAYYETIGSDLQHTFAVFRGDLITYNAAIGSDNTAAATGLTNLVIPCSNYISSLSSGTQIYGVTIVYNISTDEYVESIPVYSNLISSNYTSNNYLVELSWSGAGITNPLFYNVYKKPQLSSDLIERELTNTDEIQYPAYNTILSVEDDTDLLLRNGKTAFKITPIEDCFVGGVTFKLNYTAGGQSTGYGTTGLSLSIYSATGTTPTPNGMISSESVLRNSDITQGTNEYTVKFNSGVNLDQGTSYWLVIDKPSDFTTALGSTSLYTRVISGGSGQGLTSVNNGTSWTGSGGTAYYKFRGYLDDGNIPGEVLKRGIKLTNRIALEPRQLSVYVPNVEDLTTSNLVFNGSTTGIATTDDQTIKNDLIVTVIAKNGDNGIPTTLTTTIPKGTLRNQRFTLGNDLQVFDRVIDAYVTPGENLTRINNGPILWDIYDLITVETAP
jgi:hypothetical protein